MVFGEVLENLILAQVIALTATSLCRGLKTPVIRSVLNLQWLFFHRLIQKDRTATLNPEKSRFSYLVT